MTGSLIAFALLSLLLAVTPGPDSVLVLRSALAGGRIAGFLTACGAGLGSLVWAVAVAFGLARAVDTWGWLYDGLRLVGAGYLIFLGIQSIVARVDADAELPDVPVRRISSARAFRTGVLSAVFNPKIGLFFIAVVPQFLVEGQPVLLMTLLLGLVDAVVAVAWLTVVAVAAARVTGWLRRPVVTRRIERGTGVVLTVLGVATLVGG